MARKFPGTNRNYCAPSVMVRSTATGSMASMGGATATGTSRVENKLRLKCVECHDPHRPPFPPMHAAPPPNTLRMGPQNFPDQNRARDPLRVLLSEHKQTVNGTGEGD